MKQIRDKVGGLDVHRDGVVACTRVTMADGKVEVAKGRFNHDPSGPGRTDGVFDGRRREYGGHGSNRDLLEHGRTTPLKGSSTSCGSVTPPTSRTSRAEKPTFPMLSGWPMWPRTGWCGPPSCPRPRSESSAS